MSPGDPSLSDRLGLVGASLRRFVRSLLFIPTCAVVLIVVLAALRLNGSSIGVVAADTDASPQAAFELRPLRSDEWHLRTPMVVRQAANGFAKSSDVGMGVHDVGVLLDFPVRSYAAIVKPNSWPYFVVGVERAFAAEWWLTVLGPFLGVYAVLAAITRTRLIPALSGLLATAAPVMAWWTVPWLGLSVLFGGLMAALVIVAGRIRGRSRYVLFGLGGWAGACLAAQLYLPWAIPLGLLFAAIAVSQLTRSFDGWKQFVGAASCCLGVFAILLAVFYKAHHVALDALADSVYPGHRSTTSAGGLPELMFDAPFDSLSFHGSSTIVGGTNQSEASSGLMLWFPIAIVGGGFAGLRSRSGAAKALAVTLIAALVFAVWALLPVPSALGGLLGLTRVQGSRLVAPLTVASAIAAGLYAHRLRTDGRFRPPGNRIAIASASFVALTGWAATRLPIDGVPLGPGRVLLLIALFGSVTWMILSGRAALGLAAACALLLFSTARVNPLQVGLGPLLDGPLISQVERIRATDHDARWGSSNDDPIASAVLTAANVPLANGVDLYAVPDTWHRIDPTDAAEPAWNRFANVDLAIDDSLASPTVVAAQPDLILITTPSCAGALQALDIAFVTQTHEMSLPCLRERSRPAAPGERWIYEVVTP